MEHTPVMLQESIEGLEIKPHGTYVDGTLGRGGHTRAIAERLTTGRVLAIDRDGEAIEKAGAVLSDLAGKITLIHGNFSDTSEILESHGLKEVDGMLFDLGVSSPQLDDDKRGFSYMRCTALDMRLDQSSELTAYEIVNKWSEERLREILYEYGEERYSGRIARGIVRRRTHSPIETTNDLNEIIKAAIPPDARREKQHPSKRSYQAIRIAVNDELESVRRMLETVPDKLRKGGRICVISFHSLEDRLVKKAYKSREKGCTCPPKFPGCVCGFRQTLKQITRKPITPAKAELESNPRARSAKLRIAQRV